jgi:hypothetical protein
VVESASAATQLCAVTTKETQYNLFGRILRTGETLVSHASGQDFSTFRFGTKYVCACEAPAAFSDIKGGGRTQFRKPESRLHYAAVLGAVELAPRIDQVDATTIEVRHIASDELSAVQARNRGNHRVKLTDGATRRPSHRRYLRVVTGRLGAECQYSIREILRENRLGDF